MALQKQIKMPGLKKKGSGSSIDEMSCDWAYMSLCHSASAGVVSSLSKPTF